MGRAHPPCLPRVCNNQHQQLLCSLPNYETGSPPHSPFPPLRTFAPCVFFQFWPLPLRARTVRIPLRRVRRNATVFPRPELALFPSMVLSSFTSFAPLLSPARYS